MLGVKAVKKIRKTNKKKRRGGYSKTKPGTRAKTSSESTQKNLMQKSYGILENKGREAAVYEWT